MGIQIQEWGPLSTGVSLPELLEKEDELKRDGYASYWVGAAWSGVSPAQQVVITPKFHFLQAGLMLGDVLASKGSFSWTTPERILELRADGDHSEPLLRADPSGPRIDLPSDFPADQFLLVQLVAFVNALSEMLERRKRMDRTPLRRSFTGEIRGRLNIARSIQKHWAGGEGHKVVCDLTEPSANIPLNQTLLEALVRCEAFLNNTEKTGEALKHVEHKARRARALLHGVERLRDTSSRHLAKIRATLRGYYAGFRPIFDLACCIVRNERFVIQPAKDIMPKTQKKPEKSMTVPFGVNMNLLFELYIRSCVEKIPAVNIEPANNCIVWNPSPPSGEKLPKRRPDVLGSKAGGEKFIIEVKYHKYSDEEYPDKDWLKVLQADEKKFKEGYARPREGFFQVVAYMHLFGAKTAVVVFPNSEVENSELIKGDLAHGGEVGNLNFIRLGKHYSNQLQSLLVESLK